MLDSALGAVGILVSIVLFLVGYRRTVGAQRERIRSANVEVEKIVIRQVVLEGYTPSRTDVARLMQGKARDFRVDENEMLSDAQLLNTVYTRIVESDLIPTDQREDILGRILPVLAESEASPIGEEEARSAMASRFLHTSTVLLAVLAGVASVVGGMVSVLPEIARASSHLRELVVPALATIFASLGILSAMIVFYRFRTSQESAGTKAGEVQRYVGFEFEVARALHKLGVTVRRAAPRDGADFILELPDKRILIEVKVWKQPMPSRIVTDLAERLTSSVQRTEATEAVVITPEPLSYSVPLPRESKIKFMTLPELRSYVVQLTKVGKAA